MPHPGKQVLPALPAVGQALGGKYQLTRVIGEGGMASVFEAQHQRLHQRVAIKVLTPELARDPELVARFEREARAVAAMRTRHVARVIDVDVSDTGVPYIVMELLEGRDLDVELQERGRIPLPEAIDCVLQTCAAMNEAHGLGIVHRDLKPANLFLADDGDDRVVKVLDFGISKIVGEATRLTSSGTVMGTVHYMSPEQVRAVADIDTRADIWSLGVILYELLAGRTPWQGNQAQVAAGIVSRDPPDLRSLTPVPEGLAASVHTMLQRDPARRFPGVRDVVLALAPFAAKGSLGAAVAEQAQVQAAPRRASGLHRSPLSPNTMPMIERARPSHPPPAPPIATDVHPPPPPIAQAPGGAPGGLAPFAPYGTSPMAPPVQQAPLDPRHAPTTITRHPPSDYGPIDRRTAIVLMVAAIVLALAGIVLIAVSTMQRRAQHDLPPAAGEVETPSP